MTSIPNTTSWWFEGIVDDVDILCQEILAPVAKGIWSNKNYFFGSHSSSISFQLTLILIATVISSYFLRPLRIPFIAQIVAGVILGSIYKELEINTTKSFIPPPIIYTLKSFSFLGFTLHSFMLGVETNRNAIRSIGKKSLAIGFTGLLTSLAFSYTTYSSLKKTMQKDENKSGLVSLVMFNATTFFMVTCSHLNDLGISNSDVGHLAASTSMVLDVFGMVSSFIIVNIIIPIMRQGKWLWKPLIVFLYYISLFFTFRPMIIYIVSRTPDGRPMKEIHFMMIILIVLIISFLGLSLDQRFSTFLFAFSLPEEPLASILSEKVDAINSVVFFPIFCVEHGMEADVLSLTKTSYLAEFILISGFVGKFLGTLISSRLSGHLFPHALALSLILSSKGLLDIASLGIWRDKQQLSREQYTTSIIHILILTGVLLPLIKFFYTPLRQYSTINRRSVIEVHDHCTLQTLVCIYKEENIPGIVHLLEISHPTRANPMMVIALQLMQLTGRAAMPIMAPLHKLSSSSTFRSNLTRCNHIVNAFLHLERVSKGYTRLQHYIAVASYDTMHNDICKLAFEKSVSLLILPFHTQWRHEKRIEDLAVSIREVNRMVLERAPCSVAMLVDRGIESQLHISNNEAYNITMFFVGGPDDHEALAYSKIFTNHPNVRLVVVSLKGPKSNDNNDLDYHVMKRFREKCKDNDRISFEEVMVNDGAETTKVVVSMKNMIDLAIVGKHHHQNASAVFGLVMGGWTEYPELGTFGDVLASSDFDFSLLVVQQEPQTHSDIDINHNY